MVRRPLPVREVALARGRKPGSLHSADSGRDDTKKEQRGISNGLSADASKMMRRLLGKGDASARGRNPGSLHSADSGRDDTKKDSGRMTQKITPRGMISLTAISLTTFSLEE